MIQFTKRNLLLYFRDKVAVFFSLLAVMITFLLYIFVFRNLYGTYFFGVDDLRAVTDIWAISGMLAAPTVTTPLGALCMLIDDRKRKLYQDFYAAPVSRIKITAGYLLSSFLVGIIMSFALLLVTQVYIVINGGKLFSILQYLQVLGVITVSTFSGAGLVLMLVSFFPTTNAYTGFSLVLGTLMGFVCGNYMPMGLLPEPAQWFIKICPVAHSSALIRQILIEDTMQEFLGGIEQIDISFISQYLGIELTIGSYVIPPWVHIAFLTVTGILFYSIAIPVLSRKRK